MTAKERSKTFRSYEQLKAELFPNLTEEDRRRSAKSTPQKMGSSLADEAIETLLRDRRKNSA